MRGDLPCFYFSSTHVKMSIAVIYTVTCKRKENILPVCSSFARASRVEE